MASTWANKLKPFCSCLRNQSGWLAHCAFGGQWIICEILPIPLLLTAEKRHHLTELSHGCQSNADAGTEVAAEIHKMLGDENGWIIMLYSEKMTAISPTQHFPPAYVIK